MLRITEALLDKVCFNQHTDNWYFSWIIAIALLRGPVESTLIVLGESLHPGYSIFFRIIIWVVLGLLLGIPVLVRIKITWDMIAIFLILFIAWAYSFLNNNMQFLNIFLHEAILMFGAAFPFYCFSKQITDFNEFKSVIYRSSYLVIMLMVVRLVVSLLTVGLYKEGFSYDAESSNMIAPACVACIIAFVERRKMMDLVLFFGSFLMILIYGARRPLACALIAVILLIIEKTMLIARARFLYITRRAAFIISSIILFFSGMALLFISDMSFRMGNMKGRLMQMIHNGSFLVDPARKVIWSSAINYIVEHPFVGTGLIADRLVLTRAPMSKAYFGDRINDIDKWTGMYAHNIFLELFMQFGLFFGLIIASIILYMSIMLFVDNCESKRKIAIYLISVSFGQLLVSSTAFRTSWFWIMMGMASTSVLVGKPLIKRRMKVEKNEQ